MPDNLVFCSNFLFTVYIGHGQEAMGVRAVLLGRIPRDLHIGTSTNT